MDIKQIFGDFFAQYVEETGKTYLSYVTTSSYRPGNPKTNPHAIMGNAMDITLRTNKDYSAITEYKELLNYCRKNWKWCAGADLTPQPTIPGGRGNVHIHLDLNGTERAKNPFFFIEDNGLYQKELKEGDEI